MKAKDLRLGNWVICNDCVGNPMELQVTEITKSWAISDGWHATEPIPLTEDWLVRFGFTKKIGLDDMVYYSKDGGDGSMELYETLQGFINNEGVVIEYVHQLQNYFYFTFLTGEELEIKEG